MATDSKFPAGESTSRPMQAYLQNIESRKPSDMTPVDTGATLAELIAAFNQLKQDLNR